METKVCTKCGIEKPATNEYFYKSERGLYGLRSNCKECANKATRERKRNPVGVVRQEVDPPKNKKINIVEGKTYKFNIPKQGQGTEKREFFAKAIEDYNNFVVFQTKHYKESFQKVDLAKFKIKEA